MANTHHHAALLCAVALGLSACATVRVVARTRYTGELALEGERGKALDKAYSIIEKHCKGPYQIQQNSLVVVGTETVEIEETRVDRDGRVVKEKRTTTQDKTEWRIRYLCGLYPPPRPPPPRYDD